MNSLTLFQFFRYLIPGGVSLLYLAMLKIIGDKLSLKSDFTFITHLIKIDSTNMPAVVSVGAGIFILIILSLWGYMLNIIHQSMARIPLLGTFFVLNHRSFFEDMERVGKVKLIDWRRQPDANPVNKIQAVELSKRGAWTLFDSEYYRRSNLLNNTTKGTDLLRHEGLFDYWHGSGTTLIGMLISFFVWYVCIPNAMINDNVHLIYIPSAIFATLLIANFWRLKSICQAHVEGAFATIIWESDSQVILYVGGRHLSNRLTLTVRLWLNNKSNGIRQFLVSKFGKGQT